MKKIRFRIRRHWVSNTRPFVIYMASFTVWGRALVHLAFDYYKKCHLFEVRCKNYGSYCAVEMMEAWVFENLQCTAFRKEWAKIIFTPLSVLNEYEEKDYALKTRVNIGI